MSSPIRSKVVIAGGGPAALEAALTLNERLPVGERELCIVAPNASLTHRPLSAVAEFATHPPHRLALEELASSIGARLVRDRVVFVDEERRRLLTGDGDWIGFDFLLLAVGGREHELPHEWLRWPSGGDPPILRALVSELGREALRVAVIVPARAGWAVPGYELALILARAARAGPSGGRVWLITEDERPLEPLGPVAEDLVMTELRRAEVSVLSGLRVKLRSEEQQEAGADWFTGVIRRVLAQRTGSAGGPKPLDVRADGTAMELDSLISLPIIIGPEISGVAADPHGFASVDEHCRVAGSDRIWAAGDCTGLPLKHSTLAVAQADAAADALAARMGARLDPAPFEPVLSGVLVSGAADRWLAESASLPPGLDPATHCLWWPPGQVLGSRLARYVATRDPSARPLLISHPHGIALRVHLTVPSQPSAAPRIADRDALLIDTYARRVQALRRVEHEADERLEHLEASLERQRSDSREVLGRLNAAGYLVKNGQTS